MCIRDSIIRACESRVIKKLFNAKPEGKSKAERQKLRWRDVVSQHIINPGIMNWKNMVMNRDEWR